jgi:hypothetical protein
MQLVSWHFVNNLFFAMERKDTTIQILIIYNVKEGKARINEIILLNEEHQ